MQVAVTVQPPDARIALGRSHSIGATESGAAAHPPPLLPLLPPCEIARGISHLSITRRHVIPQDLGACGRTESGRGARRALAGR